MEIIGYRASDPNYKGRESGALQAKCNYQHQNRRAYFTKEDHGSLVCRHLGRGGDPVGTSGDQTSAPQLRAGRQFRRNRHRDEEVAGENVVE